MEPASPDKEDTVCKDFRAALKNYKDFVKYLETLPSWKLTLREKGIVKNHGSRKKSRGGGYG